MINAIQIAVSGLDAASRKASASAADLANTGLTADTMMDDVANLQEARSDYRASVKVIQAASDMDKDLLHIFDRKV